MARILVVDDDPNVRRAIQLALETKAHAVLTAASKEEGEEKANSENPDLIVLDVMMPEGTEGFHLVWKLRQAQDPKVRDVPIIMVTGIHDTTELRFYPDQTDGTYKPGEFLPVQGWIDKPVKPDKLLEKIEKLLGA